MYRWLFGSSRRAWGAFGIVLALLSVSLVALVRTQLERDLAAARQVSQRELTLLGSIVTESLRRGQYQRLDYLLREWGASNSMLITLRVTAQNHSVLGAYARGRDSSRTLQLSLPIDYSYRGHALLTLSRDLGGAYERNTQFAGQAALLFLVFVAFLGLLVHLVLRRQHEAEMLQLEISERRRVEEALHEAKERAEVTLHSIGDAVITTDQRGTVDYMNPIAASLTGWPLSEATGQPLMAVFNVIDEETGMPAENPVERCLREGVIVGLANHTVLISRGGNQVAIEDSAAPIRNRDGEISGVVMVFHDVTQSRALAHEISWQASHDALTGLINRREFENMLMQALASSQEEGHQHALLYLDLDQFKVVNDTCGHVAGDELLRQLSALLQRHMRASDRLARLGGDEFGILLAHCPLDKATAIAEGLRKATRELRFMWDHKAFDVSASIGVAAIDRNSGTLAQTLSRVDLACYMAKERGRNRYHVYEESDAEFARRHGEMLWVTRITQGLRENQFTLYRQTIQPLGDHGGAPFYEVLLRMRNQDGTLSKPGSFLPAAERYDLMCAVDRWVITTLFTRFGHLLRAESPEAMMVTVNLSGASLNDNTFMEFVRNAFIDHDIAPSTICFEITETVAITHFDRAIRFITSLRGTGCRFALDDFGSGLSSFGYLKNIPLDFLKIDGGLVHNIVNSRVDAAMVAAINEIGHVMGLKTIAEFVEDDETRNLLAAMGVDYIQGYLVDTPEPFPLQETDIPVKTERP
jgi:diguanylate cyclase (GGDEF)-like protein/PAS domain S-box-containing protein